MTRKRKTAKKTKAKETRPRCQRCGGSLQSVAGIWQCRDCLAVPDLAGQVRRLWDRRGPR